MYEWAFMYRLNNNQDFGVNDDDDDNNEMTVSIIIIMIHRYDDDDANDDEDAILLLLRMASFSWQANNEGDDGGLFSDVTVVDIGCYVCIIVIKWV